MSTLGATPTVCPIAGTEGSSLTDEVLIRSFNEIRDELISTLMFLLGNRDDAQDAAQEAFLKCWRARENFPEIHNLRAGFFASV